MGEKMKREMNKAKRNYKKKIRRIYIELYPPDEDIKNKLNELNEPTATYIKRLIRQDLKRSE